jgi:multicomponent Na+:H+ antiporter subunit A
MMLGAVLLLLIGAALAPLVHRAAHHVTGWLLALLPASIVVWGVILLVAPGAYPAAISEEIQPLEPQISHLQSQVQAQIQSETQPDAVEEATTQAAMPVGEAIVVLEEVQKFQPIRESYEWIPSLGVNLTFLLDGLSLVFMLLICGIGMFILIYAGKYLHDDQRLGRFFCYLMLFMGSMLGLVLADNLYLLFVFWEMTSISSFLLIGWDHHRAEARKSALTALLVTGGGGLMMMAGLVLLQITSGQIDISAIDREVVHNSKLYLPILLLIFAGAATKSAQFPFHFWLPGAMAAPTPVSAYLHSATMVKAGIYLMARLSPALGDTNLWYYMVTGFGAVTMVLGAVIAVTQKDLKRILAYSTVSVLGALMMLLGIGTEAAISAAVVYLVAHSLYKGALFMGAGTLDHETSTRDITQLRGLAKLMPISAVVAVLAAASNAGMIPLFGFISKELFYEAVYHAPMFPWVLLGMAFIASLMLVVVGFMVAYRPYFGGQAMAPQMPHEAPLAMWLGAAVLALLSLILGVFPVLYGSDLGSAAASAVLGEPVSLKLAIWHGLTPILGLSVLTLLLGTGLFFLLHRWQHGLYELSTKFEAIGPQKIYDLGFNGLMHFAHMQTSVVQNGYLRNYVLVIVATMIALVAQPMLQMFPYLRNIDAGTLTMSDIVVGAVILGGALAANRIRSRLAIVAILGSIGICVMIIYVFYGAMDLALTQIMVESLTTVLLVLVIYHLPRFVPSSSTGILIRDGIVSLIFGGVMTMLVLMSDTIHPDTAMREFFVDNSYTLGHGRNIVNVILVDFRAMDTLGEITVLSVAGIGVYALLKIRVKKEK